MTCLLFLVYYIAFSLFFWIHPSVPPTSSGSLLFLSFVRNTCVPFSVRWAALKWVTINSEDIRINRSQRSVCESHLSDKQQTPHHSLLADMTAASSISSYVWHDHLCVPMWVEIWRYGDIDPVDFKVFDASTEPLIKSSQRCSLGSEAWDH